MHLKVLMPFQVFSDKTNVTHIVVDMWDTLLRPTRFPHTSGNRVAGNYANEPHKNIQQKPH